MTFSPLRREGGHRTATTARCEYFKFFIKRTFTIRRFLWHSILQCCTYAELPIELNLSLSKSFPNRFDGFRQQAAALFTHQTHDMQTHFPTAMEWRESFFMCDDKVNIESDAAAA